MGYSTGGQGEVGVSPGQEAGPPGWPNKAAHEQWVLAGSDPNMAVNYGWADPGTGVVPGGYKP